MVMQIDATGIGARILSGKDFARHSTTDSRRRQPTEKMPA